MLPRSGLLTTIRVALVAGVPALAAVSVPSAMLAQSPLALEGRMGALAPLAGFRSGPGPGEDLSAGLSIGVLFALERRSGRHLLLGFSQHRLDCRGGACGTAGEYVATAWDLGVRFDLGSGATVPWVRVSLSVPRVEVDGAAEREGDATDLGVGGEVGAGVRVGLAGPLYLSPGVRFGAANTDLPAGGTLRMRYLVLDVGLVVGF